MNKELPTVTVPCFYCGKPVRTLVPFVGGPVFCSDCFDANMETFIDGGTITVERKISEGKEIER